MSYFGSIYSDSDLSHRARSVYMYLHDRSSRDRSCWPSIRTIAADLHLSRSTVKRALNELVQRGYLSKTARYRPNGSSTSNSYTLL